MIDRPVDVGHGVVGRALQHPVFVNQLQVKHVVVQDSVGAGAASIIAPGARRRSMVPNLFRASVYELGWRGPSDRGASSTSTKPLPSDHSRVISNFFVARQKGKADGARPPRSDHRV